MDTIRKLVIIGSLLTTLVTAAHADNAPLLIRNAAVIDGRGNPVQPMRDVLIIDGKISSIAVTGMIGEQPKGIKILDGTGMTVMPGLIDLHVHLGNVSFTRDPAARRDPAGTQRALNAHLNAGVMTVLDLGNDHDRIVGLRDDVASGKRTGPRIVATGDNFDNLDSVSRVFTLSSPEAQKEIRDRLDKKVDAGISTIKIYAGMSNWEARHVMVEAKKRNMVGIADLWCSNLSRTVFEVTMIDGYAHGGCRALTREEAEWMAQNDKFAILTLSIFDIMGGHRAYEDYETRTFLKDPLITGPLGEQTVRDYYTAFPTIRQTTYVSETAFYQATHFPNLQGLLAFNLKNAKTLADAGVLLGMGSDAPAPPANWPGEAMHYELELHVRAGIDPIDAIRMATMNGAQILRLEKDIGSVEVGKIADLMIVDGDPSTNIRDTRNIEYLIQGGRLVDRKALVAD